MNEAALAAVVVGDEPLAAACVVAWSWAAAAEQAPCLGLASGWTIHPDDVVRLGAAGETALAGEDGTFLCEHRVLDAAGQVRWVESRGRVVRGRDSGSGRIVGASIDVTSRRQREDELRASAERRRLLAEVTAEGVCLHDGLHLLEANESLARMFGYGSAAEMVGLPISALPAAEWVATGLARVAAGFEGAYTLLGRRKDGSTFPIELSAREVGLDGQRLRAGRIRDVSEHKAAEAALRESEERLRLAVEVTGLGIFDVDPATGERRWSPEFKAILGLPPDTRPDPELYGSLIHPADQAWVNQRYWSTFRGEHGGLYDVEYRILRASDGALRWVHNTGRVFFGPDGRAERAVGTLLDITDRKTAEEALLAAETVRRAASEQARWRLEAVIEGIAEAVTAVFPKEGVWLRNAAWLPIHGFASFEELPGHHVSDFSHLFEVRFADGSAMARLDWAVTRVLEGQSFSDLEVRLRRLDKEHERWVSYNGTAVRDPDGSVALAILTMRDITARKKAEERQALLLAELSHRVKNTLAVVQGIAARSLAPDRPPAEGRDAFTKRLRALARAHSLLTVTEWRGASLRAVVESELQPYGERAVLSGPELMLEPKAALTLALALHELATNAAKHGALSAPEGRVEVAWSVEHSSAHAAELRLTWREHDGPPVRPPARRGFGSALVEQGLRHDLDGTAVMEFRPDRLACELTVPVAGALAASKAT